MKKFFMLTLVSSSLLLGTAAFAQGADKLNLAGSYKCTGYDSHEGAFEDTVTFTFDEAASAPDQNFGSYTFVSKSYTGYIAAQGTDLAFYFKHNNQKDALTATDHGVGIGTVTFDEEKAGKFKTSIHSFYFQPDYQRNAKDKNGAGGRGTSLCVKVD